MSATNRSACDPYTAPNFATAALITIDTQRDVLDGGPLKIPGTSTALGAMQALTRAFRGAGRPIIHIVRLYQPDGANVDPCRRQAVQGGMRALAPGTLGSELAAELLPEPKLTLDPDVLLAGDAQHLGPREVAIYKPRWGAFYDTALEDYLRKRRIDTLVFCGCNFPNCPRTSIYEASERDFRIVLARNALSGLYERGERELAGIGVHPMNADEIAKALLAATRETLPSGPRPATRSTLYGTPGTMGKPALEDFAVARPLTRKPPR